VHGDDRHAFTNGVSLRVRTQPIAINPTVAIGEGQAGPSAQSIDFRIEQLYKLRELRDTGILTDDEFAAEKARILDA
jgi:hypothetical protein